jgi:formate dehydrogenase iron-sulfur subunit
VKACPTDCLNFGKLADMREMAYQRLKKVKSTCPTARLLDPDDVRVIFLTAFPPNKYHQNAASFDPTIWQTR